MPAKLKQSENTREAGFKVSQRFREWAGLGKPEPKRQRHPDEALPPADDLFARPVYSPASDNDDGRVRQFGIPRPSTTKE